MQHNLWKIFTKKKLEHNDWVNEYKEIRNINAAFHFTFFSIFFSLSIFYHFRWSIIFFLFSNLNFEIQMKMSKINIWYEYFCVYLMFFFFIFHVKCVNVKICLDVKLLWQMPRFRPWLLDDKVLVNEKILKIKHLPFFLLSLVSGLWWLFLLSLRILFCVNKHTVSVALFLLIIFSACIYCI